MRIIEHIVSSVRQTGMGTATPLIIAAKTYPWVARVVTTSKSMYLHFAATATPSTAALYDVATTTRLFFQVPADTPLYLYSSASAGACSVSEVILGDNIEPVSENDTVFALSPSVTVAAPPGGITVAAKGYSWLARVISTGAFVAVDSSAAASVGTRANIVSLFSVGADQYLSVFNGSSADIYELREIDSRGATPMALTIQSSALFAMSTTVPVTIAAKTYAWTMLISSAGASYVSVGGVANANSTLFPASVPALLAIPANTTVSVLGVTATNFGYSEVRQSS